MHNRNLEKNKTHNQYNKLTVKDSTYKQWVFRYTFLELEKDLGENGDITTNLLIDPEQKGEFILSSNSNGVIAGLEEIRYFLKDSSKDFKPHISDIEIKFYVKDGEEIQESQDILLLRGKLKDLFAIERVVVNFLSRMSGVATLTYEIVKQAKRVNPDILITPTRKTLWGLLDKKAVTLGGGGTHRLNLSDAVLIKDNHLAVFKNKIDELIEKLSKQKIDSKFLEIEVSNKEQALIAAEKLNQLKETIETPCVIMFDNMDPHLIADTITELKAKKMFDNILFEASGGITKENIVKYAHSNVDILSLGLLTNNAPSLDFSMEVNNVYK